MGAGGLVSSAARATFKYRDGTTAPVHAFTDLSVAAYCPRQLYYRRREGTDPPDRDDRHELAFRYPELLDPETDLSAEPVAVDPTAYRSNLGRSRARLGRARFRRLAAPSARDVLLEGRDARGIAHKLLEEPPAPSLVVAGTPPETGVWEPHTVRAVAMAKALAWERERRIGRAYVEYPTHGVIRELELDARRTGIYRRALRTAESIDGPPPRLDDRSKCETCEYRDQCGVRTRSLRSLLGKG
jgi:CRISPR-associated exonuclease Cas4